MNKIRIRTQTPIIFGSADAQDGVRTVHLKKAFDAADLPTIMAMTPWSHNDILNGVISSIIHQHNNVQDLLLPLIGTASSGKWNYVAGIACEYGNADVLNKIITSHPQKLDIENLIDKAAEYGHNEAWTLLMGQCSYSTHRFYTSMEVAAQWGQTSIVRAVLDHVTAQPQYVPNHTALHEAMVAAINSQQIECVMALMDHARIDANWALTRCSDSGFWLGAELFLPLIKDPSIIIWNFIDTEDERIAEVMAPYLDLDLLDQHGGHLHLEDFKHRIVQAWRDRQQLSQALEPQNADAPISISRKM